MAKWRDIKTVKVVNSKGETLTIKLGHKYVHGSAGVLTITKIEMECYMWKRIYGITNLGMKYVIEQFNTPEFRANFLFEVE